MNTLINHKKQIKKTRLAIAMSIALGIPAFAQQDIDHTTANLSCPTDQTECKSELRGRIDDDSRLVNRSRTSNTERRLPNETVTIHALPAVEKTTSMTTKVEEKAIY